jgi:hypothetical protein
MRSFKMFDVITCFSEVQYDAERCSRSEKEVKQESSCVETSVISRLL